MQYKFVLLIFDGEEDNELGEPNHKVMLARINIILEIQRSTGKYLRRR